MRVMANCAFCGARLNDREELVSDGRRYAHARCVRAAGGTVSAVPLAQCDHPSHTDSDARDALLHLSEVPR